MDKNIPIGPQALTAEWLTYALRETGTIGRTKVKSFKIAALGNEQGITGNLARLGLFYDTEEESAPRSLIAKFATTDPESLEIMFTVTFHYEREIRFYEKIATRVNLRTPHCYYSAINVEARKYFLLLEDMAPVKSGDLVAGCSPEQAELAIREIAGFHATWWESPELEEMTWMPQPGSAQIYQLADMYQLAWDPFCERMGHRLPKQMLEIGDRLGRYFDSVWFYIQERPWTIVHSDYHVENLFFTPPESGTGLVVADWQLLMFGRGVFDIAYLLGGNLDPKDRVEKEMHLLRIYHEILMENDVKDYTFDQCFHDYRFSMLYSLSRYIIVTGAVLTAEQAQKACEFTVSRYIAAVLDLNAGELLPP